MVTDAQVRRLREKRMAGKSLAAAAAVAALTLRGVRLGGSSVILAAASTSQSVHEARPP